MTTAEISQYVSRQIQSFFPEGADDPTPCIKKHITEALDRLYYCMEHVVIWKGTDFYPLHSEKNTVFLYYLANTIWENEQNKTLCEKLFYLNKSLNGFHCFYDTKLPDIFFVGHSVGIVLANTTYSDYLALYQGVTVGKNHGKAPHLEKGIVLYPGSSVIGDCLVRSRTYLAQNNSLIDQSTPGNGIVFVNNGIMVCKTPKHDILRDLFLMD
ncbi:hypothetical protein [Desulfolutivibrio sulfoxidireducens]|uniref:hypothetical protein n=1 Tax=Desulfolutivibrio sulfoxidireducens TaxID=2773299 RepID=UPI00159E11E6|nr:hypothetical protein [Desulfolutivibrio sulfoxidireducens]QLA18219.1 hypothetical protein GD605_18835 [Desulfolutivibrio sulfoxidireducens]